MAPAVKTFLHQQDFTGKTVVPFMTNGGWPGHVIKDMKAACKGANVVCDMQIQFDSTGGSNLETPQEQINEWIQSVKNLLYIVEEFGITRKKILDGLSLQYV